MKRFYTTASVIEDQEGYGIALDGRPVRTPGRAPLIVPTQALAEAIAGEWNAQGETIDPRSMMLTGLANAAIDRVAADPVAFSVDLAAYGESDLTCYRADSPAPLVARQAAAWDPLLHWAQSRFDIAFVTVTGVMHRPQHPLTVERLANATAARDPFALAALSPLVTISGSLVAALALAESAFEPEAIWDAVTVDERWQAEQWGEDALEQQAQAARRADFLAAARFLALSRG